MGNSLSASSSGKGGKTNKRPTDTKFPLTVNSENLESGHYVALYTGLDVVKINEICKSMDAVATITDLTLVIIGARSTKNNINTKYIIKSVKVKDEVEVRTSSNATDEKENDKENKEENNKENDENEKDKNNLFEITLDKNYYMLITTSLCELANEKQIKLLRSIDQQKYADIKIGSKHELDSSEYFDAFIDDDMTTMKDSKNPINPIKQFKIFMELPAVPTIHLNIETLQLQYNSSYAYVAVCNLIKLKDCMAHINTVKNNANILGIYYYNKTDTFIADAVKKFIIAEDTIVTSNSEYSIFSVGHNNPDISNKTIQFRRRIINLTPDSTSGRANFKLTITEGVGTLVPNNISIGYQQPKKLFIGGADDKVTQVFMESQIIQFRRSDFQLYIGYIDPLYEIDIIGTLMNANNIPKKKFILYCKTDVVDSFKMPTGLFKTAENGITNIENLEDNVNISNNYYLTLGVSENANIEDYDIVNKHGSSLNISTLRNNEVKSKQALLSSHTGDMKAFGAYVPDSELLLPNNYKDDKQIVLVCAMETSPSAVWNMAKNLANKYNYTNWILYFSLLKAYTLGKCTGYTSFDMDNDMKILYPSNMNLKLETKNSFSFEITSDDKKVFIFSQKYIKSTTRAEYIGSFSVYPGKVPSTESEYQQYKYSLVQNLSYIKYDEADVGFSLRDTFIGGMPNTLTIYANIDIQNSPEIDQTALTNNVGVYFDYLPSIQNAVSMQAYINTLNQFMLRGSNEKVVKYCCLMRVRKEWIKTPPPEKFFEVIEGQNPDYVIIFMFGGTDFRYKFDAAARKLHLKDFPDIIFNTEIAKSKEHKSDGIYVEDPLPLVIKARDEKRYINVPLHPNVAIRSLPIINYDQHDGISISLRETEYSVGDLLQTGTPFQKDLSFTRYTYFAEDWTYFFYILKTLVNEPKTKANCVILFHIRSFDWNNIEMPSLRSAIEEYIKTGDNPFEGFSVVFDNINNIYILSNVDVIIDKDSKFYTFGHGKLLIKSKINHDVELSSMEDLLLNMIKNKFEYNEHTNIYSSVQYYVRPSVTYDPMYYQQVDKAARKSSGVTLESENIFWSSVSAFVYIEDLDKFEVENLIDMAKYLYLNLYGFYIVSKVSYDNTSIKPYIYNNCIVIRGNDKGEISINETIDKNMYYIKIYDSKHSNIFMKFGLWINDDVEVKANDIKNIDFLINKTMGVEYDTAMKVFGNERLEVKQNYMNFKFPNDTVGSFPKFVNFTTHLNKYILFARPIPKEELLRYRYKSSYAILTVLPKVVGTVLDFSEIVNFVVQWYTIASKELKYIMIYLDIDKPFEKPSKEYKLTIDNVEYNTADFTYTERSNILIYPKIDINTVSGSYKFEDNVSFSIDKKPVYDANLVQYYIEPNGHAILLLKGKSSGFKAQAQHTLNYLDMRLFINEVISK
ncbi:hypothetical protein [Drosophila suzukii associated hytrosavirus 1]|nr:hypothetical protein [Drosophila suzukii associated hytrosavirus 1]